jgi:thiamine transport system ATP-binding protein
MLKIDQIKLTLDSYPLHYDLCVAKGEIVALQGPSGVGKTTLLNIIAGFIQPESGSIQWDESPIQHLPAELRPVSMLFQDHNLFEHISVWDNLLLGFNQQAPTDKLLSAAQALGIEDQLNKRPGTLSGGQRQRVALIRTMLRDEPIILLDEPFAELDPSTREAAGHWTRSTAKSLNKTVLLVTHQEEDVVRVADRMIAFCYPSLEATES